MSFLTEIVGGILTPVTEIAKGWGERKLAKITSKNKILEAETEAHVKHLLTAQAGDIAWETKSIDNSGWRDEYWTVVISVPLILGFCGPVAASWVRAGFESFSLCPQWYQWAVSIAIGSAFGVKEFTKFMKVKKGS